MAERVGEAYFEIRGDDSKIVEDVERAGRKVEEELGRVEAKAAESAGRTERTYFGRWAAGFKRAGDAAARFQAVVSRIAIPVAVVATIASIIRALGQAEERARALREEMGKLADELRDALAQQRFEAADLDDLERRRAELRREAISQQERINELVRREVEAEKTIFGTRLFGASQYINATLRIVGLRRDIGRLLADAAEQEEQIRRISEEQLRVLDEAARRREQEDRRRQQALAEQIREENDLIAARLSGDEERLASVEHEVQLRRLMRDIEAATSDEVREALRRRTELLARENLLRRQAIQQERAERIKAEQEAAREAERLLRERARREQQQYEQMIRSLREEFERLNQSLTVTSGTIARAFGQLDRAVGGAPRRVGGGA